MIYFPNSCKVLFVPIIMMLSVLARLQAQHREVWQVKSTVEKHLRALNSSNTYTDGEEDVVEKGQEALRIAIKVLHIIRTASAMIFQR